jgi:hypothetical protein
MGVTVFTSAVAAAGTPQRLTAGASPALAVLSGGLAGTIPPRGGQIKVTADPANTAGKTLWIGGPALSVGGNSSWFAKLAPGATMDLADLPASIDPSDFFVDTDGTVAKYGVEVVG